MLSLVTLSISLLFSFATAQSQVTWLEPGNTAGAFAYAASVVDACPDTTILALQCTSGAADALSDLCGSDGPVSSDAWTNDCLMHLLTCLQDHDHDRWTQPGALPRQHRD